MNIFYFDRRKRLLQKTNLQNINLLEIGECRFGGNTTADSSFAQSACGWDRYKIQDHLLASSEIFSRASMSEYVLRGA